MLSDVTASKAACMKQGRQAYNTSCFHDVLPSSHPESMLEIWLVSRPTVWPDFPGKRAGIGKMFPREIFIGFSVLSEAKGRCLEGQFLR